MPRARHSSVGYSFFIFFFSASPALRRLPFLLKSGAIQRQNQLLPAKINKTKHIQKTQGNPQEINTFDISQGFWLVF